MDDCLNLVRHMQKITDIGASLPDFCPLLPLTKR